MSTRPPTPPGVRLALLTHPATAATHDVRFAQNNDHLDVTGRATASAAAEHLAGLRSAHWLRGPSVRCAETADAFDVRADVDDALDDVDHGAWQGSTLDEVAARDPAGLHAWLTDPDAAPHGGESLTAFLTRIATWLNTLDARAGALRATAGAPGADAAHATRFAVVTHQSVVRAVLLAALDAPPAAFWRLDVAPLTRTDLSRHGPHWTIRRTAERLRP